MYRAHWNSEKGLKCYLYESSLNYNEQRNNDNQFLSFDKLAAIYGEMASLNEIDV